MSEVKGTLLAIVLAITVFSIVFAVISLAIRESSDSIAQRIRDSANKESNLDNTSSVAYTFHNN